MNIINAQAEVLKEVLNEKRKHKVIYGLLDDKVIIGNEARVYIMPKRECCIDLTNIEGGHFLQKATLKNFINVNESTELILTNDIKKLNNKITARILTNGKENIYLDERLIKNFDLKKSSFKGRDAKSAVFIYENGVMVGFLMPVFEI